MCCNFQKEQESDGAVEVAPTALDTNVGLIDTPRFVGWLAMAAEPLLEFGAVALDPAPDCRVVCLQAACTVNRPGFPGDRFS